MSAGKFPTLTQNPSNQNHHIKSGYLQVRIATSCDLQTGHSAVIQVSRWNSWWGFMWHNNFEIQSQGFHNSRWHFHEKHSRLPPGSSWQLFPGKAITAVCSQHGIMASANLSGFFFLIEPLKEKGLKKPNPSPWPGTFLSLNFTTQQAYSWDD